MIKSFKIPDIHKEWLHVLLHNVTKVLDFYKITYWADGGTLLGCFRNGGQIEHDDDCDLGVWIDDFPQVVQLYPVFKEIGFSIEEHHNLIKIFVPGLHVNYEGKRIKTPTLDIFAYKQKHDEIVLDSVLHRQSWKNAKHKVSDFYPLVRKSFDSTEIWTPCNPMPYLFGLYGDDCMTENKIYLTDITTQNAEN